jgi:CheY-like chemotaxis protein
LCVATPLEQESMGYILVVDDEDLLCDIVATVLSDEGYEVTCALSGAEAFAIASKAHPDLIITDLRMAIGSGADFIRMYRQLPGAHARIIVLSGVADLDDEAARLGVDGFICKPFELGAFVDAVASAIPAVA